MGDLAANLSFSTALGLHVCCKKERMHEWVNENLVVKNSVAVGCELAVFFRVFGPSFFKLCWVTRTI